MRTRTAATLIELLVVIAILSLLVAILLPAVAASRKSSRAVKCLTNLREIAGAAHGYAAADRLGILLPSHPLADVDESFRDGYFDFGGADGSPIFFGGAYGPNGDWSGITRPLNQILTQNGSYTCPEDSGVSTGQIMVGIASEELTTGVAAISGTSYWGNAIKTDAAYSESLPLIRPVLSYAMHLRPLSQVPSVGHTVLFVEPTLFASLGRVGAFSAGDVRAVVVETLGWHSPDRHSAAFVDGHAGSLLLRRNADLSPRMLGFGPWGQLALRGAGFQFDCFPAPTIVDLPR